MNGSTASNQGPSGMLDSVNAFGADLTNLATLQLRLAACDLRESTRRLTPTLALAAFALTLFFGSVIVGLFGAGYWIAVNYRMTMAQAFFLVAGVGLFVSAAVLLLAIRLSRGSFVSFRRSSEEFQRNLTWIRTVMKYSGR